jgi:hypothetical protein
VCVQCVSSSFLEGILVNAVYQLVPDRSYGGEVLERCFVPLEAMDID